MEVKKTDRRVKRTINSLNIALFKLMSEKSINKITVTELAELANVNRATFYLYYQDIYQMVQSIEDECLEEFSKSIRIFASKNFNEKVALEFLTFIFQYTADNSELSKILLGCDGDCAYIDKFKNIIIDEFKVKSSTSKEEAIYFFPFIISGTLEILKRWVLEDMPTPPKNMAKLVMSFITNGKKLLFL